MQSVPIATKIVSSNLVHVYSIQHYVIKFVSDVLQVDGFLPSTPVSSTNKTDRRDKTEILLKVALNTINQTDVAFICRSKEYLSTAGQVPYIPVILE